MGGLLALWGLSSNPRGPPSFEFLPKPHIPHPDLAPEQSTVFTIYAKASALRRAAKHSATILNLVRPALLKRIGYEPIPKGTDESLRHWGLHITPGEFLNHVGTDKKMGELVAEAYMLDDIIWPHSDVAAPTTATSTTSELTPVAVLARTISYTYSRRTAYMNRDMKMGDSPSLYDLDSETDRDKAFTALRWMCTTPVAEAVRALEWPGSAGKRESNLNITISPRAVFFLFGIVFLLHTCSSGLSCEYKSPQAGNTGGIRTSSGGHDSAPPKPHYQVADTPTPFRATACLWSRSYRNCISPSPGPA
ncbi:hypothetical protein DFH27DRAFT_529346 [Peziza echinospora]|nr:hypothetical protein DFH27DRAFT_529346 [Peziza echinospora]